MAYNWRETTPLYASISGVLAGFSITFIVFLLREDQSTQQIAYGISWVSLSALMMGATAVLFIQASQYFLTAKDHDVYGMPEDKRGNLNEEAKGVELAKNLRNVRFGGLLYNVGRVTLFLGVGFALFPFFPIVAVLVGAGGIGFEVYQVVSASKPVQETKPNRSALKPRRRSLKTYARLTLGVVILIGINYTFTKLFDMVFGKSDGGSIIGTLIVVFFFIGFFTLFLWRTDSKGALAHMMGARDEDE